MKKKISKRQVVLDIETTGMNKTGNFYENHRIIEIGAIELIDRKVTKNFLHYYLKPDRSIDKEAYKIHGISEKFLLNSPRFQDIYKNLFRFLMNSEIIVHNSSFDIEFIDYEFFLINPKIPKIRTFCSILDTLSLARTLFPGKKNNLNALCKRYNIPILKRKLHGALLDAKLLTKIYLYMTSKQESLLLWNDSEDFKKKNIKNKKEFSNKNFLVIYAEKKELKEHKNYLKKIGRHSSVDSW